ncbi:hypothetical protein CGRA01v4_01551 [Colletotrichum graminicola]|uniref:Sulfate permease II n=1 Tax=Colletotrichum graminicola (strain M1.001 / M2 / FGSC 10212) TaxID=645133 RepID=E3QZM2_COLGM|nr:uncharacterized protein GLRG_11455 [Colletotrichum graminicola M1.001]EFQ36310.1 hypothetical protein GLRG_11455 [Colletotrichum graminicola M1.001]WDK10272.1 hypothetical protein CGRA01v4_01551 [Colletotrichum graminicola]
MRLSSDSILRASLVAAAWLASTVRAIPKVVDRDDPPPNPPGLSLQSPIATAEQVEITGPNPTTTTTTTTTTASPPLPQQQQQQQDKPPIPITVQLFESSPGVKTCRGSAFVKMVLPADASKEPAFTSKDGQCYDLTETAQCGIFAGNKADGCEAKLFRGSRCTEFANLAVFQEELRPVGGFFTSISIKCGIAPVEPKPLSLGNLGGKLQKPPGKGSTAAARAVDAAMRAA